MDAYEASSPLDSAQWGAPPLATFWMTIAGRLLRIPGGGQEIPWEMVAMPTGTEQPDQLTSAVNC